MPRNPNFGDIWSCTGFVTSEPCGLLQVDGLESVSHAAAAHADRWSGTKTVILPSVQLIWLLFARLLVGLQPFPPKNAQASTASDVCQFYVSHAALNVPAGCTVPGGAWFAQ